MSRAFTGVSLTILEFSGIFLVCASLASSLHGSNRGTDAPVQTCVSTSQSRAALPVSGPPPLAGATSAPRSCPLVISLPHTLPLEGEVFFRGHHTVHLREFPLLVHRVGLCLWFLPHYSCLPTQDPSPSGGTRRIPTSFAL